MVATYRLGESVVAGNYYSLRIPIEAFNPLTEATANRIGALLYLSVRDSSGVRVTKTASVAARGKLVRVDFTQPDTDGDGLPDSWEQQYFNDPTIADPNDDPDMDGRNNLAEYLAGTNPLIPDGRHPADNAPANDVMTFAEADTYADAWLAGSVWPHGPTNIPIAYVTSAALLALNGGNYVFTNLPPTNAPHWWVNIPNPIRALAAAAKTNHVLSQMPSTALFNAPIAVSIQTIPSEGVQVYAVEDQVPPGSALLAVSHGGTYDSLNHKVKWGPFYDAGARELTYQVMPGTNEAVITFKGVASFDALNVTIAGDRVVAVGAGGLPLRWVSSINHPQGPAYFLSGDRDCAYVIEASTNFVDWLPLQTNITDNLGRYLFKPVQQSNAQFFYRARTVGGTVK